MKHWKKICFGGFVFLAFGISVYMNAHQSSSTASGANKESSSKVTESKVTRWYSRSPQTILSADEAETEINNIHTIQKAGWKLLMQNGQPVSFNPNTSGRNEIIEKAAVTLINGCYELLLDGDGNIVDIRPSEDAKKLLTEQQTQMQEQQNQQKQKQEQDEHDRQHDVIQNNIDDIHKFIGNGYRFSVSNDGNGTITTWNIKNKNDNSPSLEYSIKKLMDMGISVKSDTQGKVIGFGFNQTDFYEDKFNLYEMME